MTSRLLSFALRRQQQQVATLLKPAHRMYIRRTTALSILPQATLTTASAVIVRHNSTSTKHAVENGNGVTGTQYTRSDILINSLKSKPIATAADALHRIAEARSVPGERYLAEILSSMREPTGDTNSSHLQTPLPFQKHLLSEHVCQDLLEAIVKCSKSSSGTYIDTQKVQDIYGYARSQGWEIDSLVLVGTATLLAKRSFDSYIDMLAAMPSRSSSQLPTTADTTIGTEGQIELMNTGMIAELERGQVMAKELQRRTDTVPMDMACQTDTNLVASWLDSAVEIAHTLVGRSFALSVYSVSVLARALGVHGRVADSEWLFNVTRQYDDRYKGSVFASMMSLYYQIGMAEKAEELFSEFQSSWQGVWNELRTVKVMRNTAGVGTEKWRLENDEHVDDARVMSAGELKVIREKAAGPYFQRALAILRDGDISGAVDFVIAAKHTEFVVFTPDHFDTLAHIITASKCLDLGYKLFQEIGRGTKSLDDMGALAEQVIYAQQPYNRTRNMLALAFARVDRWDIVWRIIDYETERGLNSANAFTSGPRVLMPVALRQSNMSQTQKCAKRILAGLRQYADTATCISDNWLGSVFELAGSLQDQLKEGESHPIIQVTDMLLISSDRSHGTSNVAWNARVLRYAFRLALLGDQPHEQMLSKLLGTIKKRNLWNVPGIQKAVLAEIADVPASTMPMLNQLLGEQNLPAEDKQTKSKQLRENRSTTNSDSITKPTATGKQSKPQWRVTHEGHYAAQKINNDTPVEVKLEWYRSCRQKSEVPEANRLMKLVAELVDLGRRQDWEPIARDHMPEYLDADASSLALKVSERVRPAIYIWTSAVIGYVQVGEIEEATHYLQKVIDMGGFLTPYASATLLLALTKSNAPLPVLRANWSSPGKPIFGLEPILPPSGQSPGDLFLVSSSQAERNEQLAQIGLFLLYSCLRYHKHSSNFYYNVLFGVLGKAKMASQIRHIFETVIPASIRALPPADRINPAILPTPLTWGYVISVAMECGERTLAEYWFKEYRMSAMPIFREEGSSYSRIIHKDMPMYARLFNLANPYYIIPPIWRPLDKSGREQDPAYDLAEVEQQLEMDRLRALDKLPLPFKGARKMLAIYTCVEEHRDLKAAESLAAEIIALSQDRALPRSLRRISSVDFALCWRYMVKGYLEELQYLQAAPTPDFVAVRMLSGRLVHWHREWEKAYARALKSNLTPMAKTGISLTSDEVATIRTVAQR